MTVAKPKHLEARALMLRHLDMHPGKTVNDDLDPLEAGIVGDTSHAEGGDSYHLGEDQIRARGTRSRYSVDESSRDAKGLDEHASGIDYGWFAVTVNGRTWTLFDYNEWLIGLCRAGDPDTRDLREVIYTPDGRTVRRWDDLGIRSSGDSSHTSHTHHSEYRDADGHRMVNLARRWLTHIGLIPLEDDMSFEADQVPVSGPGVSATNTKWTGPNALGDARDRIARTELKVDQALALLTSLTGKDFTDEQAIVRGVLADLAPGTIAAAIPADIARQVADELAARIAA